MNVVNRSLLRGYFEVTTIKPVSPGGLFYGLAVRRDHWYILKGNSTPIEVL
ncbi:MAG: hypothetical protein QF535_04980 [Anaerolineales bacterium]|nr:hypothetical protein [Anaerolineales bacterium]